MDKNSIIHHTADKSRWIDDSGVFGISDFGIHDCGNAGSHSVSLRKAWEMTRYPHPHSALYPWPGRDVQLRSHVEHFAIGWTAARQASLSSTISQTLLKFMFIELVIPSKNAIHAGNSPGLWVGAALAGLSQIDDLSHSSESFSFMRRETLGAGRMDVFIPGFRWLGSSGPSH